MTYDDVLNKLEQDLINCIKPDEPIIARNGKAQSFRQIVQSVRDKTPQGLEIVERWIKIDTEKQHGERWDGQS